MNGLRSDVVADACRFIERVGLLRRRFWLTFLVWWVGIVVLASLFMMLHGDVPDSVETGISISFFVVGLFSIHNVRSVKCPYCQRPAGASAFSASQHLRCKSCNRHIECAKEMKTPE